jgi:AcrR family transcriptional regulator
VLSDGDQPAPATVACQEHRSRLRAVLAGCDPPVVPPTTARERARAELTAEIADLARAQLATVGAAGLSLRAVARELGMASSAMYRYFASRDELLTRLIIDGYDALGAAAEQADDPAAPPTERWLSVCRATRAWALAHPHEYALLYGSPVPGYVAPEDTLPAAGRVGVVLGRIATEGHLDVEHEDLTAAVSPDVAEGLGIDPGLAPAAVEAWTTLFGIVGFELFGQYRNVVLDRETFFDHVADRAASSVGLP